MFKHSLVKAKKLQNSIVRFKSDITKAISQDPKSGLPNANGKKENQDATPSASNSLNQENIPTETVTLASDKSNNKTIENLPSTDKDDRPKLKRKRLGLPKSPNVIVHPVTPKETRNKIKKVVDAYGKILLSPRSTNLEEAEKSPDSNAKDEELFRLKKFPKDLTKRTNMQPFYKENPSVNDNDVFLVKSLHYESYHPKECSSMVYQWKQLSYNTFANEEVESPRESLKTLSDYKMGGNTMYDVEGTLNMDNSKHLGTAEESFVPFSLGPVPMPEMEKRPQTAEDVVVEESMSIIETHPKPAKPTIFAVEATVDISKGARAEESIKIEVKGTLEATATKDDATKEIVPKKYEDKKLMPFEKAKSSVSKIYCVYDTDMSKKETEVESNKEVNKPLKPVSISSQVKTMELNIVRPLQISGTRMVVFKTNNAVVPEVTGKLDILVRPPDDTFVEFEVMRSLNYLNGPPNDTMSEDFSKLDIFGKPPRDTVKELSKSLRLLQQPSEVVPEVEGNLDILLKQPASDTMDEEEVKSLEILHGPPSDTMAEVEGKLDILAKPPDDTMIETTKSLKMLLDTIEDKPVVKERKMLPDTIEDKLVVKAPKDTMVKSLKMLPDMISHQVEDDKLDVLAKPPGDTMMEEIKSLKLLNDRLEGENTSVNIVPHSSQGLSSGSPAINEAEMEEEHDAEEEELTLDTIKEVEEEVDNLVAPGSYTMNEFEEGKLDILVGPGSNTMGEVKGKLDIAVEPPSQEEDKELSKDANILPPTQKSAAPTIFDDQGVLDFLEPTATKSVVHPEINSPLNHPSSAPTVFDEEGVLEFTKENPADQSKLNKIKVDDLKTQPQSYPDTAPTVFDEQGVLDFLKKEPEPSKSTKQSSDDSLSLKKPSKYVPFAGTVPLEILDTDLFAANRNKDIMTPKSPALVVVQNQVDDSAKEKVQFDATQKLIAPAKETTHPYEEFTAEEEPSEVLLESELSSATEAKENVSPDELQASAAAEELDELLLKASSANAEDELVAEENETSAEDETESKAEAVLAAPILDDELKATTKEDILESLDKKTAQIESDVFVKTPYSCSAAATSPNVCRMVDSECNYFPQNMAASAVHRRNTSYDLCSSITKEPAVISSLSLKGSSEGSTTPVPIKMKTDFLKDVNVEKESSGGNVLTYSEVATKPTKAKEFSGIIQKKLLNSSESLLNTLLTRPPTMKKERAEQKLVVPNLQTVAVSEIHEEKTSIKDAKRSSDDVLQASDVRSLVNNKEEEKPESLIPKEVVAKIENAIEYLKSHLKSNKSEDPMEKIARDIEYLKCQRPTPFVDSIHYTQSLLGGNKTNTKDLQVAKEALPTYIQNIPGRARNRNMISLYPAQTALNITIPFDEIPGPKFFHQFAKLWQVLPMIGMQITSSTLQFFLAGGSLYGSRSSWKKSKMLIRWLQEEYGSIIRLPSPLGGNIVLITNPDDCTEVLTNEGRYPIRSCLDSLEKYRLKVRSSRHSEVFLMHGKDWESMRKQAEITSQESLKYQYRMVEEVTTDFIGRIMLIRNMFGEVPSDFHMELQKWSLESLWAALTGEKLGFMNSRDMECYRKSAKILRVFRNASKALRKCETGLHLWKFVDTPAWHTLSRSCDILDLLLMQQIRNARAQLKEKYKSLPTSETPLIQSLLLSDRLFPEDIQTILLDMCLIGVNATSHTVSFLMYHLARNPRYQKKLMEEIASLSGTALSSNLDKYKYLEACIRETLRLEPPLPFLSRILTKDIIVRNYRIPRGTHLLIATSLSGTKEELFEDALKYNPDRWLSEGSEGNLLNFICTPFGYGPKGNIAKDLARFQLSFLIIKLLQSFKIEYEYGEIRSQNRFIPDPDRPLRFKLRTL